MLKRAAILALVVATIDCGKTTPSSPSLAGPAAPVIVRLQIEAPESVPPGSVSTFKLIATRNNGTTEDVGSQATWSSSDSGVLETAGAGQFRAIQDGEAGISAVFGSFTARRVVMVLAPGTFKVSGSVLDSGFGAAGARVEVTAGIGSGKATTANGFGAYQLYGMGGDVEMRASLSGYNPDVKRVTVTAHQRVNFAVTPLVPPVDMAGSWRLTFEASAACTALPEAVRSRSYDATIEQNVSVLVVRLGGAEFLPDPAGAQGAVENRFGGRIVRDEMTLKLQTYDYYGYGTHHDLGERVPDVGALTIDGTTTMNVSGSGASALFSGTFTVSAQGRTTAACTQNDHRIVLTRAAASTNARRIRPW